MVVRHVVVCGGGIGGLTVAIALRRVGVEVTLLEKRAVCGGEASGSGIALWRNGLRALDTLGLSRELDAAGARMPNLISYRSQNGAVLAAPPTNFSDTHPVLCLQRSDLTAILHENALSSGVEISTSEEVSSVSLSGTAQSAVVATCTQAYEGDMVIGADGLHSKVRSSGIFPGAPSPQFMGYRYWRATLVGKDVANFREAYETWSPRGRFGFVPLRRPELFWFWSELAEEPWAAPELSKAQAKERLLGLVKGLHAPVEEIVQLTPAEAIFETPIHQVDPRFEWADSSGRVLLLGDACHSVAPNLAQGAGLAIEDAVELAALVRGHNSGTVPTLTEVASLYQQRRRHRAATVQRVASWIAAAGHLSGPAAVARNAFMRSAPDFITSRVFGSFVDYTLGGDYTPPSLN